MKYIVIPISKFIYRLFLTILYTSYLVIVAIVSILWTLDTEVLYDFHVELSETIIHEYSLYAERRHYKNYLCAIWRIGKYTIGKSPNIYD